MYTLVPYNTSVTSDTQTCAFDVRGANLNLGLCWCASASYQKCPGNTEQRNLAMGSSRRRGEDWQGQAPFAWQANTKTKALAAAVWHSLSARQTAC